MDIEVDYQRLLTRYMEVVLASEGIHYIEHGSSLSTEDIDTLLEIAEELGCPWPKYRRRTTPC